MTRQKIIESAISILNSDFSASLERIAGIAAINRRTLHRYFKDRETLLEACWLDMITLWQDAVLHIIQENEDPIVQLRNMFYTGIDNGIKFSFLIQLYKRSQTDKSFTVPANIQYEEARNRWLSLIPTLKKQHKINAQLPTSWILLLFSNLIISAVEALKGEGVSIEEVKNIAWYSFSKGIGIHEE